ncbi:MAG: molybdate ABC transporter substrate-binding protein [Chloroflexi bacterium]|nr:molybdate ABC transporter substrate-binding protein [Chloroflexota bacterium]
MPLAPPTAPADAQGAELTVFAAASLADAFGEIGTLYTDQTGIPVRFNFGASSQLRTQLEQGARADVFASADQAQMDRARAADVLDGDDVTFATNRLVIITPASDPGGIRSPADLARPGVRLVTAAPEVPIGAYTQAMLDAMSQSPEYGTEFKGRANANVVSREPNVRQVVAKIQLGEGDAAVVYLTDVTPQSAPDLRTIEIPAEVNMLAAYPIALVAGGPRTEAGASFIAFVLSPAGQGVLQNWNFTPVGPVALAPGLPVPAVDSPGRMAAVRLPGGLEAAPAAPPAGGAAHAW